MENIKIPNNIAIIMDGNGRWAKDHHLTRSQGHLEGVKRVEEIISEASSIGVKVLTLYAFSTENWSRPQDEVSLLMQTLITVLNQRVKALHEKGIRFSFIGRKTGVPEQVLKTFKLAEDLTHQNKGMVLNIAFNYGSRAEIIDGIKDLFNKISNNQFHINDLNESSFNQFLYTKENSEIDLLIRTSGEQRISNFLLWQISYAELYFTNKNWPDFSREEFHKAISEYSIRDRRYGGIKSSD